MEPINKLLNVDTATTEQLAASKAETNRIARLRAAEIIDRIDRGGNVESFAFAVYFADDEEFEVTMGGDGRTTFGLIDTMHFAIVKQTVNNGVLVPGLVSRLEVARTSEAVDDLDLITVALAAASIAAERGGDEDALAA